MRTPARADLAAAGATLLKAGGPTKADLKVVDLGEGPLVVKDFAAKAWWVRALGRFQIAREHAAYRWIGPLAGVPRLAGRVDPWALAVEKIDGEPLGWSVLRTTEHGPELFRKLSTTVDALHRRGLVHWDLRAQENVLVRADLEVFVLDFASALRFRPGGLPHRLLFRWCRAVDRSALLKWKPMLGAGPYTPEEARFVRRFGRWRSLWVFNPKGERRRGG